MDRRTLSVRAITLALLSLLFLSAMGQSQAPTPLSAKYEGFGAGTRGGAGQAIVRVTNLNDSGPGSLRHAVSQGNRTVVFDVAGEIAVKGRFIDVKGAFITIDGFTAPPPGIALKNGGIRISGMQGAHDIIVRGIRVRNSPRDGIQISRGAYNVVIDHVSVQGSGDENIGITLGSHDVTISWSIFAEPAREQKNMLISENPSRVTLHHNLFVKARQRNPKAKINDLATPAADTTLDMRNNLVWDWEGGYGTLLTEGAAGNVVNNYYWSSSLKKAIRVSENARAYVSGNYPPELNGVRTEATPFPAPAVDTTGACAAAHRVLARAGARPLDLLDERYLSVISLPSCP